MNWQKYPKPNGSDCSGVGCGAVCVRAYAVSSAFLRPLKWDGVCKNCPCVQQILLFVTFVDTDTSVLFSVRNAKGKGRRFQQWVVRATRNHLFPCKMRSALRSSGMQCVVCSPLFRRIQSVLLTFSMTFCRRRSYCMRCRCCTEMTSCPRSWECLVCAICCAAVAFPFPSFPFLSCYHTARAARMLFLPPSPCRARSMVGILPPRC